MTEQQENRNLQHLGEKLRYVRQQRRFSLRDLAARSEVSPSLLSQIENGKANPSVMTLHNIASALDVPLAYFFPSEQQYVSKSELDAVAIRSLTPSEARAELGINLPHEPARSLPDAMDQLIPGDMALVVRSGDRASIALQGGVIWQRLTAMAMEGIEFLYIEYDVGGTSGSAMSRHPGREFGYMLEGELLLDLGFDEHHLYAGDSVVFNSRTPHRLSNAGDSMMRAIWVVFNCQT